MSRRHQYDYDDEALDDILDHMSDDLETLAQESSLLEITQEIEALTQQIKNLPLQLAQLRQRGYVHAAALETQLTHIDTQWQTLGETIQNALGDYQESLDNTIGDAEALWDDVDRKGKNRDIRAFDKLLAVWEDELDSALDDLRGMYEPLSEQVEEIGEQLEHLDWIVTQLEESEIILQRGEGPLVAAEAVWQQTEESGPKGILYLTDQRLLFEQKEKIATKKFLGILATESKSLQSVQLEIAVPEIEAVEGKQEGGFLGMGKSHILAFTFAASAPVSRARFLLKEQEVADWAKHLKQVRTGAIHRDRASAFAAEVKALEKIVFPTQCPHCFAPVPKPATGVTAVTCEYCNITINGELS